MLSSFRALAVPFTILLAAVPLSANEFVRMDLNLFLRQENYLNTVFIELFDDRPLTRDNFLQYVDGEHYDDTIFHRLADLQNGAPFVLQGGGFYESYDQEPSPIFFSLSTGEKVDLDGNPSTPNPSVNNEFSNSPPRSNVKGTLAMAKTAAGPDSATNQLFFNLGNNSANLDNQNGGFTVFAQVVGNGMDLIDSLTHPNLGLSRDNLNPDELIEVNGQAVSYGQDGDRDSSQYAGPFTTVPRLGNTILKIKEASRVNYIKSGSVTQVPTTGLIFSSDTILEVGAVLVNSEPTSEVRIAAGASLETFDGLNMDNNLVNSGTLSPGIQTGVLDIDSLWQLPSGTTRLQIGGTTPGADYDQINIQGGALLHGALEVERLNQFAPSAGDSFLLMKTGVDDIFAGFTTVNLFELPTGLVWDYNQLARSIVLDVVAPDFNGDGMIDAADFTIWRDSVGQTGPELAADANGDQTVDVLDYNLWRKFFGHEFSVNPVPATSATPEPSSLILALLVGGAFGLSPRRLRRN